VTKSAMSSSRADNLSICNVVGSTNHVDVDSCISSHFVSRSVLFLLASALSFAVVSPAHALKLVKWDFYLLAGAATDAAGHAQYPDAGFGQKKTICFPDGVLFISRVSPKGDYSYADDSMQSNEHLVSVDGPIDPSPTPTCISHSEKHPISAGKVCIDFWIDAGPAGAHLCGSAWNMKARIDDK
jgi:hypothetical protein